MAIPTITVTPSAAAQAYRAVDASAPGGSGTDFGGVLQRAVEGVVDSNRQAEALSMQAITGQGSLTDVVTAVSKAELALQTTMAVRDRVVQAYQDIMKMPI
jgi:flagellar hook-basal body complex protein FliE